MRIRIAAVAFGGMLCLSLFAHAVQASRAPAAAKRPIAIEDEIEYAAPFSLSLSPDARHVAYVLQTRDIASNTVSRDLFVVSADGKSASRKRSRRSFCTPSRRMKIGTLTGRNLACFNWLSWISQHGGSGR
jgi:hypothetical protein